MRHNIRTILVALLACHAVHAAVMSDDYPTRTTASALSTFSDTGSSLVTSDKGYADQYAAVPVSSATVSLLDPTPVQPAKGLSATQLYASDALMALAEAGLYAFLAAILVEMLSDKQAALVATVPYPRGVRIHLATVPRAMLAERVGYFEALDRFKDMAMTHTPSTQTGDVDLAEFTQHLKVHEADAAAVWAQVGICFAAYILSSSTYLSSSTASLPNPPIRFPDVVNSMAEQWAVSLTLPAPPSVKPTKPLPPQATVSLPVSPGSKIPIPSRSMHRNSVPTSPSSTTGAIAQPTSSETSNFVIIWQLLYTISDYLAMDATKHQLIESLLCAAHQFDCKCLRCVGKAGAALRLVLLSSVMPGMDAFTEKGLSLLATAWMKTIIHSDYAQFSSPLRNQLHDKVIASVTYETATTTVAYWLDVSNRSFCGDQALLDKVQQRVLGIMGVAPGSVMDSVISANGKNPVPSRTKNLNSRYNQSKESPLLKVWNSDKQLRRWILEQLNFETGIVRKQKIMDLTTAFEWILQECVSSQLNLGNVVGHLKALDQCVLDSWHLFLGTGSTADGRRKANDPDAIRQFDGFNFVKTLKQTRKECIAFAAKRWMNLQLVEGDLSRDSVKDLCIAAGIAEPELFGATRVLAAK
ncbi:hypothetical protein HDU81_006481 [Chytriomyces hyalinus]|nr:hypothetical protein HDU81_006468 [Chytriomyces hyalinus]KAJ3239150.1 hypothetical protein HDU81_006481 [Chytriomyces hyalinus]